MSYTRFRRGRKGRMVPMGDAVAAATPTPDSTLSPDPNGIQQQLLATAQNQLAYIQAFEARERTQKWIAIGVTAAIPVFSSLWRMIIGRRRRRMEGL